MEEAPLASNSASLIEDAPKDSSIAPQAGPDDIEGKPALSKSQQKKLARKAKLEADKPARRAREKAARKENRAAKRKLVEEEGADPIALGLHKKQRTLNGKPTPFDANIVIDLSFDDKMTEKEIKSMATQLGHVHSVNRTSPNPMKIIFAPLDGRLRERMDGIGGGHHLSWKRVTTLHTPLEELWQSSSASPGSPPVETHAKGKGKQRAPPHIEKDTVIYLTADSGNVLTDLDEGQTYIIGGIVDHNRYKNLCLGIAKKQGIKHASLPIGQYIEMASRKVLTVNQCFEIMHRWVEYRDWEKAFYEVIPSRKLHENKPKPDWDKDSPVDVSAAASETSKDDQVQEDRQSALNDGEPEPMPADSELATG